MRLASGTTRWLPSLLLPLSGLLFEYSGLDQVMLDAFYDPAAARFRFGEQWWSNDLLHEGGRALIKAIALVLLLVVLAGIRARWLRRWQHAALYLTLCIAISCGLVNTGKALSNVDCPWSLQRYGGDRPYVHVFADRPDDLSRGHCFPSGHAAGGYSLLGLYFVALSLGWRRPRIWLLPGAAVGLAFGIAQWSRSAHFPSHDLWAIAVCWTVAASLYREDPSALGPQRLQCSLTGCTEQDGAEPTEADIR